MSKEKFGKVVEVKEVLSPPSKLPIEYRRDPEDFATRYANNAHVETSVWDMKITFGQTDLTQGPNVIIQHTAITIPWPYVKIFLYLLQVNIVAHEAEVGHVAVPASILGAPPPEVSAADMARLKHPKEGMAAVQKLWKEFIAANPEAKPHED